MNISQFYLVCLVEECAELAQACTKALVFGELTKAPENRGGNGIRNNRDRIADELTDVRTVVNVLQRRGVIPTWVPAEGTAWRFDRLQAKLDAALANGEVHG